MACGVYIIRNTVNGKVYVGSAVSFKKRWQVHKYHLRIGKHHSASLQRSWNKHGEGSFIFEIIEETDPDQRVASEQKYIDIFRSAKRGFGYNISPTAGSPMGVIRSSDVKVKMSLAKGGTGNILSESETVDVRNEYAGGLYLHDLRKKYGVCYQSVRKACAGIESKRVYIKGIRPSMEAIAKMSASKRGRKLTPETRAKIGTASRGRRASPETIEKIAVAKRGKKPSLKTRAKMSTAARGRIMPLETRAKISASKLGRKNSPEHIANMVAARWGLYLTEKSIGRHI